ncbi:glyoxylase-like metal-dependent hydrolase (beta-lactamase superfamily II) [Luteibacter jiangsuensis]|uniref:Glyoxylase-like metal-dependent hydrolase (Beta-lactamase superfamily II) n=1 Tax=Luteibacter jiangsuensis TaxID=637577 RepID=A0ABT9T639_9GAMM|nr:MBL fold metallo-hydrolase [Luteibacter jiangsuensis]MDQ0011602.1 glyoxylase-like metal-dependent hydrolase (beta-lactamase superfamily II) [Luteibacter jiangsuensis]
MSSVPNIARPAAQPPQELVPSRYAVKVGDIDVLVISDGVMPIPAVIMAANAAPTDLSDWLGYMYMPPDTFDWPLNVMVVRSGEQTILIDAGLGIQFPGFPRTGQLPQRLASAGIDLASITDVVITHMHMDHVGGLLVEGVKEGLRPDVRIHVNAAEVAFWEAPDFTHTAMPPAVPPVLRSTAQSFANEYRDRIQTFDESYEVAPGVVARRTGGHTPGHSVVALTSRGERLTFAGDAVFPVGFDHPEWSNGFEHDPEEAARVRLSLFREMAESGSLMVATHLPFPSVGRVAISGDAFRWVPVIWDF